jgi:hypothetical protein
VRESTEIGQIVLDDVEHAAVVNLPIHVHGEICEAAPSAAAARTGQGE